MSESVYVAVLTGFGALVGVFALLAFFRIWDAFKAPHTPLLSLNVAGLTRPVYTVHLDGLLDEALHIDAFVADEHALALWFEDWQKRLAASVRKDPP